MHKHKMAVSDVIHRPRLKLNLVFWQLSNMLNEITVDSFLTFIENNVIKATMWQDALCDSPEDRGVIKQLVQMSNSLDKKVTSQSSKYLS